VAQTLRFIPSKTQIEVENARIMLDLAPFHLKKYLTWDLKRSREYVKRRSEIHESNGISKSNGVGTQIYASVVDRVPDALLRIPSEREMVFRNSLEALTHTYSFDSLTIYTLVISARAKPHHGSGLQRYLAIIRDILKSPRILGSLLVNTC
jgi:hypothetical protein